VHADAPPERARPPRRRRFVIVLLVALALLAVALFWASRPPRVAGLAMRQLGGALGLEISARGVSEYTLRGSPSLTLREVTAREPGSATPLLRAERIHVRLPWRTLRAPDGDLVLERVELDAPQLDLPALQRWLARRPPGPKRAFAITDGLAVEDGMLRGDGWRIERIALDLPRWEPNAPLEVAFDGRYVAQGLATDLDFDLALSRPALPAMLQLRGRARIETPTWTMPATFLLSGPLQEAPGGLQLARARFGLAARHQMDGSAVPFRLGLHGPLRLREGVLALQPATMTLRPQPVAASAPVPSLDARGALALGERLVLRLDGVLAAWPDAWPALPAPLAASRAPLPFALRYAGASDLGDVATLQLRRERTTFDGRFRLPAILEWVDAGSRGSPLPPLDGRLATPRLEIAGATLEGVQIELHDEAVP